MSKIKRIAALLLLTAYAVAGTSVMPALTLMLADLDQSHLVQAFQSSSGTVVLLGHESEFTPKVGDHGSRLARLVASLSRPTEEGSHLYTSKRLRTLAANDTGDFQRQVKKSAEVNLIATRDHVVILREAFSITISPPARAWTQRGFGANEFRSLDTVRLLI